MSSGVSSSSRRCSLPVVVSYYLFAFLATLAVTAAVVAYGDAPWLQQEDLVPVFSFPPYLFRRRPPCSNNLHNIQDRDDNMNIHNNNNDKSTKERMMKVAFLGNSILYFNDCPRLMEQMLKERYETVHQDSCLRPGATLTTLWERGNGMRSKFSGPNSRNASSSNNSNSDNGNDENNSNNKSDNNTNGLDHDGSALYDVGSPTPKQLLESDDWDFVVLNDHTQNPARESTRQETIQILRTKYIPLLMPKKTAAEGSSSVTTTTTTTRPTTVLLQTFGYRCPGMRGTEDLGNIENFTRRIQEGYCEYQTVISEATEEGTCLVAPVGQAVLFLHQNYRSIWEQLYSWDDFHPSPYGTWLEACVLFCTITHQEPPVYNPDWWSYCRYMQPPEQEPLPRPTADEAEFLRRIACKICNIQPAVSLDEYHSAQAESSNCQTL